MCETDRLSLPRAHFSSSSLVLATCFSHIPSTIRFHPSIIRFRAVANHHSASSRSFSYYSLNIFYTKWEDTVLYRPMPTRTKTCGAFRMNKRQERATRQVVVHQPRPVRRSTILYIILYSILYSHSNFP